MTPLGSPGPPGQPGLGRMMAPSSMPFTQILSQMPPMIYEWHSGMSPTRTSLCYEHITNALFVTGVAGDRTQKVTRWLYATLTREYWVRITRGNCFTTITLNRRTTVVLPYYFNGTVQLAKTLADHVPEETMNYLKGQFTINVVDS